MSWSTNPGDDVKFSPRQPIVELVKPNPVVTMHQKRLISCGASLNVARKLRQAGFAELLQMNAEDDE